MPHYDSSHLSLMSFVICQLKSSLLLFERFSSVNYSNSRRCKLKTTKQSFSKLLVLAYENFVFVLGSEERENGLFC